MSVWSFDNVMGACMTRKVALVVTRWNLPLLPNKVFDAQSGKEQ